MQERGSKPDDLHTGDDKLLAFARYKNFIKHKKRKHMKLCQQSLCDEFIHDPKSFWEKLRSRTSSAWSGSQDLAAYASSLYFFPNAPSMPMIDGDPLQFTENEVKSHLSKMKQGKAKRLKTY